MQSRPGWARHLAWPQYSIYQFELQRLMADGLARVRGLAPWSAGFLLMLALFCSTCLPARAEGARPVRLLVVTKYVAQLREAQREFEKRYGSGLITLELGDEVREARDLPANDVVYLHYYVWSERMNGLGASARTAAKNGTKFGAIFEDNLQNVWRVKPSPELARAEAYLRLGGTENLVSFLALLYHAGGGRQEIKVSEPKAQGMTGIYHPRADRVFDSLSDYLQWYRTLHPQALEKPLVGITFYANNYNFQDLAHVDRLIKAAEERGLGVVPIFGWPLPTVERLFLVDGHTPIGVLLALNLTMPNLATADFFEKHHLHVINLMTSPVTQAEWQGSMRGLPANRVNMNLNTPEAIGGTEPILGATSEKGPDGVSTVTKPIAERVEAAVARAQRWITLQTKPNAEKRLALIYYNNPPGKGNLGASYLDVPNSLAQILNRLKETGYETGGELPSEHQLLQLLEKSGRNVEQWAPGELDELVSKGNVILWPVARYRRWFDALPKAFRESVVARWGEPERSSLMTVRDAHGVRCFVIPGIRLGNLFLGPQPLRTTFAEAAQTAHDSVTPVPHQYIAAYLWYRHEFRSDAVVHIGRHGTLEWLPGKDVAQAAWDHSEAMLGDMPDIYYYIIDGGGEAIQARRRGAAVLIGHLTPMIAAAGVTKDYRVLYDLLEKQEHGIELAPEVAAQYQADADKEITRLKLCAQLGWDCAALSRDERLQRADQFLHELYESPIPLGLHTVGVAPSQESQQAGLREFLRSGWSEKELPAVEKELAGWTAHIAAGEKAEPAATWPEAMRERIAARLREGESWWANLQRSPSLELDNFIVALNGHYVTEGQLGDPLRQPASMPSGRNLHDFDIRVIPTRQAWELGKRMATEMLGKYRREHGRYPRKVSLVLWYGESIRHMGAMEAEALYLMGVEPIWNSRGVPDQLKIIPVEQLGRPRIDVLLTISGIYRDGMQEKVLLLDQAARLAAEAPGANTIREHNQSVKAALIKQGLDAKTAEQAAMARVYGSAPGAYGVGIERRVEQSLDEGQRKGLAEAYVHNMNFLFTQNQWGEGVKGALIEQLRDNDVAIHSRSTNVYGMVDNDDVYQFLGGLSSATVSAAGKAPDLLINNLRAGGKESVQGVRGFLATELNGRLWNPRWIEEMKKSGYAGARQFSKETENLYGFQATAPEQMDGAFWQNTYDVYVADKHGLEMERFFDKANPNAQQSLLARLLEVDRQGTYKFSDEDRARIVAQYVHSVNTHGMGCSANTCGNLKLMQYAAMQAAMVKGLGRDDLARFAKNIGQVTHLDQRSFQMASADFLKGLPRANVSKPTAIPRAKDARVMPSKPNTITGRVLEEVKSLHPVMRPPASSTAFRWLIPVLLLALFCGVYCEWRKV